MTLWNYIKRDMMKYPHKEVCEKDAVMTYEELINYSGIFAKSLLGEKCCAIYCQSELATAISVLGCIAADVTAVPLSIKYGPSHCNKILQAVSPTCVITDLEGELGIFHITDSEYKPPKKHPAFIMCTSGTTGVPKCVMLSSENIITNIRDISKYFTIRSSDTILITRPLYHCAVLTGEFLVSLTKGLNIVFYSEQFVPSDILNLIKKHNISVYCGTPTILKILSRFAKPKDCETIRHLVISGECMDANVGQTIRSKFLDARIYHVYGLTEASPRVSYMPPSYFDQSPGCVGIPLDSVEIKIADPNGVSLKKGSIGTLWVKGKNIMIGYYNASKLTSKVLRNGWLCTNDVARINDDGWLEILGRNDDLIIKAGMNIYPAEIENELHKDNRVGDVRVYGYRDDKRGTQVALDIVGVFGNEYEVREMCSDLLAPYQMPSKINILKELPKNSFGKVDRRRKND